MNLLLHNIYLVQLKLIRKGNKVNNPMWKSIEVSAIQVHCREVVKHLEMKWYIYLMFTGAHIPEVELMLKNANKSLFGLLYHINWCFLQAAIRDLL